MILRKLLLILVVSWTTVIASSREFNWNPLIRAIATVESNNNPKAIGKGGSVGLLQITPILVRECNDILKKKGVKKCFTLKDRLDPNKSKEMFILIQEKYNPSCNIEKAIRIWNGGPKYSVKATQKYFNKVKKVLK
jgi:hypothetical protein